MADRKLPKIPTPTDILERLKIKPPPQEIISPDILQTILLDEVAGRLEELSELTQQFRDIAAKMEKQMQKIPEGITYPIELTVTGLTTTRYDMTEEPAAGERTWYSCTIYNDGESDVYFRANSPIGNFQRLESGESADIDFRAPLLKKLFFKCGSATASAALRILGEA